MGGRRQVGLSKISGGCGAFNEVKGQFLRNMMVLQGLELTLRVPYVDQFQVPRHKNYLMPPSTVGRLSHAPLQMRFLRRLRQFLKFIAESCNRIILQDLKQIYTLRRWMIIAFIPQFFCWLNSIQR